MNLFKRYVALPWKRLIATFASEHIINTLREENPDELRAYQKYMDRKDFPWDDPVKSEVFWRTYRRLVRYYP